MNTDAQPTPSRVIACLDVRCNKETLDDYGRDMGFVAEGSNLPFGSISGVKDARFIPRYGERYRITVEALDD